MTRAIFLRRFTKTRCSFCCGACTTKTRTRKAAVGFAPSSTALVASYSAPVLDEAQYVLA